MKRLPSKLSLAGASLITLAVLIFGGSLLYLRLAPNTYAATVMMHITPRSTTVAAGPIFAVMSDAFRNDRDVMISTPRGTSLFEIKVFATDPDTAAQLAEAKMRHLLGLLHSRVDVAVSKVSSDVNRRPVRPNRRAVLTISGVVSLNLAIAGFICSGVGSLKRRAERSRSAFPLVTPMNG